MANKQQPEELLLERITVNPGIFSGKPIIRGRRLAVEHVVVGHERVDPGFGDSAA